MKASSNIFEKFRSSYLSDVVGAGVGVVGEPGEESAWRWMGAFATGLRVRFVLPCQQIHVLLPADLRRRARRLGRAQMELLREHVVAEERVLVEVEVDPVTRLDVVELLHLAKQPMLRQGFCSQRGFGRN